MTETTILLVEDEEGIREMLEMVLEQGNFQVTAVETAEEALNHLADHIPDLLLLDWMLPGISGVELARRIKKDDSLNNIPIILLTARGAEEDKVRGLEIGADDYVTKPFSPKELIARIKAVLRRAGQQQTGKQIKSGDFILDMDQHRLMVKDELVDVSPTEFKLMQFFMLNQDKVFTRTQLLDQVWGRSVYIEERTVDVHIRRLRKILAEYGCKDAIQTVRGFGYRFSGR